MLLAPNENPTSKGVNANKKLDFLNVRKHWLG